MNLLEVFKATIIASVGLSWAGALIAFLPTMFAFAIVQAERRSQYVAAGLLGGIAGEFCGVGSLFLSLWLYCRGQRQFCNTAQGDMGLIITVPIGSFLGSLLALCWTWATLRIQPQSPWSSVCRYSGPSRIQNWSYAIATQIAFWVLATWFFAHLMA